MVEAYKMLVYAKEGKSVVRLGNRVVPVDELHIDVPSWAEYDVHDDEGNRIAQFVIACEGIAQIQESRSGENFYRRCRIVEG
jgi:hypothetical protein